MQEAYIETKNLTRLNFSELDFSVQASYMDVKWTPKFYTVGAHTHRSCEVYINLSGDVSFAVENKLYPIKRGSVVISKPYEFHHCVYNSNCHHKHFWLLIKYAKDNPLFELFSKNNIGNFIQLNENQLNQAAAICKRIIANKQNTLCQMNDVLSLLILLNSSKQKHTTNLLKEYPDVEKAIDYIHKHFTETITITVLAGYALTSVSSLERNFKKALSYTPMNYLKELRYTNAVELIKQGKRISEACYQSGFSDYSRFIKQFKEDIGQTPKQYQKQLLGKK